MNRIQGSRSFPDLNNFLSSINSILKNCIWFSCFCVYGCETRDLPVGDRENQDLFLPNGFQASVVVESIDGYAREITVSDQGDLYVKTKSSGKGNVVGLRDTDGDGKADGGEGDDNQAGDKGKVTGDPNASGYYGIGGDGSGGNYRLSNRNALNRPEPDYPCNEEGKVVKPISIDQSGNVVSAEPGAKGTTNSASCLLNEAKKAALKTKFNPDNNAPSKQVGAIIYNFSLSN